jgi:diguanylate cyclase (GGDEF)-like protein
MGRRFLYSFYGIVWGLSVPGVWFLWRAFSARKKWWITFTQTEMHAHYEVYICLAAVAVALFAIIGYWLGKRRHELIEHAESIQVANAELEQLATTDALTGLFNPRYMTERLEIELENALRSPLTCLLIDVDHFKKINDTHGHPFGDAVLVAVASAMRRSVRRVDSVGRLGGEEFLVILPDTPATRATIVAERIREAVAAEAVEQDGKSVRATVSVGVVTYPADGLTDRATLLKAADSALYAAKRAGRNRVMIWEAG